MTILRSGFLVLLLCLGPIGACLALTPFSAEYEMWRAGKKIGIGKLTLSRIDEKRWQFSSVNEGTSGLAGLAGVEIREYSEFVLGAHGPETRRYDYRQEMAFRKKRRQVLIDLDRQLVNLDDGEDWHQLPLPTSGVLDRNLTLIALMMDVADTSGERSYPVADKRTIDSHRYHFGDGEAIDTPAGRFETRRVERLRDNPGRKTITWLAESLNWLPVRVLQIEPGGEEMELRLVKP